MIRALRSLARTPAYTAIALLTLALGIGVNTSMFSAVSALLFRGAPFPQAEQLIQLIGDTKAGPRRIFSVPELREIRAQSSVFTSLTTISRVSFAVGEEGRPSERIAGATVSEDMFATFGIQPLFGRAFTSEDARPGRTNVVLLGYSYWQQRFGGAKDVIDRTLRLDGQLVTVIGVMPERFDYPPFWGAVQIWRPLEFTPDQINYRDYRAFQLVGRLRAGTAAAQAGAELAPLAAAQEKANPENYSGWRYRTVPLHEVNLDDLTRRMSLMLLGLSGFVLLIACANLASLQLARATGAMRAFAIRAALGASRARLAREQLAESLVLAVIGGALGLVVTLAVNRILERGITLGGATGVRIPLDVTTLGIAMIVSLSTGVLFGLVPAWLASRTDVNSVLKSQSRGATVGRATGLLRSALIVGEVALALVLLGGAGVMQRGFARFLDRENGWDVSRVLTATLPISERHIPTDAKRIEYFRLLEARLAALPGVESAAIATSLPLAGYSAERQILLDGQAPGAPGLPSATHAIVSSNYFATVGIPLVDGRLFPADLTAASPRVIIVSQSLARRMWPGKSPLGQRVGSMDSGKPYWAEVIGVVRDVEAAAGLDAPRAPLQIYKPLVHEPWAYVRLIVRHPAPASMAEALRHAVTAVDPDLPVDQVLTAQQFFDRQQRNLILAGNLLTGFAILGLVLAAIGLYGVVLNLVARRIGELGIRVALGAQARDILGLVLGHGLRLALGGLAIGLVGAYALARFLSSLMPRLASPDPVVLGFVSLLLFSVAMLACWIPARKATKVDPLTALRAE